jgi:hypothetical protein
MQLNRRREAKTSQTGYLPPTPGSKRRSHHAAGVHSQGSIARVK